MTNGFTVLLASAGPAEAVLGVLMDWSATGLLSGFAWVRSEDLRDGPVAALHVTEGVAHGTSLQRLLARESPTLVRVCAVLPTYAPTDFGEVVSGRQESRLVQVIQTAGTAWRVSPLRCVIPRGPADAGLVNLGREGWHTLVVSPEESAGPQQGIVPLDKDEDPQDLAAHAAAAIAGLTGLWSHMNEAPLDDDRPPTNGYPRLARSQARWLDARAAQERLRDETLSMRTVPRPTTARGEVVYIDNTAMATEDMARAVLRRHTTQFKSAREHPQNEPVKHIRLGEAIKMFFSFLASAVVARPGQWLRQLMEGVSSHVADRFQRAIFGSDASRFEVVVGTSWKRRTWRDIDTLVDELERTVQGEFGPRPHEGAPDFSRVWRDYVEAGLTLLDAGDRGETQPIRVGTDFGVLREAARVAPTASADYAEIPSTITATTGLRSVEPFNWRDQTLVESMLRDLPDSPLAEQARDRFRTWRTATADSYAAQAGRMVGRLVADLMDEVQSLTRKLSQAAAPPSEQGLLARQRRLATHLRVLSLVAFGLMAASTALGWFGVVTWAVAWIILGSVLAVWLVTSIIMFVHGQRDLFAEINRRRVLVAEAEANLANWRAATRDLRRCIQGYAQFLQWSRILAVFVNEPFGRPDGTSAVEATAPIGLPLNVQWGHCSITAEKLPSLTAHLRRNLYRTGWLGLRWDTVLADAGRRLGPDASEIQSAPNRMFSERSGVPESQLDPWADILRREGVGSVAAAQAWAGLGGDTPGLEAWSTAAQVVKADGSTNTIEAFLGELADPDTGPAFDTRLVTQQVMMHSHHLVQPPPWFRKQEGSERAAVVRVEMSRGLQPGTIRLPQPPEQFRPEEGWLA